MGALACGLGCFPLDNGAYPPLSHSQGSFYGIRGLVGVGKLTPPSPSSALPPQNCLEAVPKYISGRTSYLRVRLAFHLYPQLIPALCNVHGFGPPFGYYPNFNLAMGSSPGFGSNPDNTSDIAETPSSLPRRRPLRSGLPHEVALAGCALARLPPKVRLQLCPRPIRALFGLAFAAAPELIFLNLAA